MASLYNADLKPLGVGTKTHPYDHATKLFVADNLRLAPKQTFLYYVVININQSIAAGLTSMVGASAEAISSQNIFEQYEAGLLVKRIELPKFSINNRTYNAYNRKNIVTNSISYDPISVSFHDDAADVVNNFWNDYYTYYYRDSDYTPELYGVTHKYEARLRSKWGYSPRNRNIIPFLRDIQIFSLHNKRFTEYRLINPIITSWRHGTHESTSNNELMTNNMTIAYETVKYRVGTVNPVDVNGFSLLHYDTVNSPISTSVTNIYSNSGLIGAIGTAGSQDLARPDGQGSGRGLFSDILGAYSLYNNLRNVDFRSAAQLTIGQLGAGAINGALNGSFSGSIFPTAGGSPGFGTATSVVGTNNSVANYPYPNTQSVSLGGAIAPAALGAALSVGGNAANNAQAEVQRGVQTETQQASPFPIAVAQILPSTGQIPFNAQTGQPGVGTTQVLTLQNGQFVPTNFSLSSNGFNPSNVESNMAKAPVQFTDGNFPVTLRTYQDGSSVATDSNNNVLYTIPPGSRAYTQQELEQFNVNALRSLDVNVSTGTRFITNPSTGLVTAVGGTTAMISNTISQSLGIAGGVIAGQKVYETLARSGLGKSLLGQVVAGGLSAGVTAGVYKATNNLLQRVVNDGVGSIGQVFDDVSKNIKNTIGSWTESGGFNPRDPSENLVSIRENTDGSIVSTYKNGQTIYEDPQTGQVYISDAQRAPGRFWEQSQGDASAATSQPGAPIVDRSSNSVDPYSGNEGAGLPYEVETSDAVQIEIQGSGF